MAALGTLSFGAVLGPEAPLIALGSVVGMSAVMLVRLGPRVGTAAGTTAVTRLLFASVLFAALLVGIQGIETVPAAVFAAVAAWLTVTALERRRDATASPS